MRLTPRSAICRARTAAHTRRSSTPLALWQRPVRDPLRNRRPERSHYMVRSALLPRSGASASGRSEQRPRCLRAQLDRYRRVLPHHQYDAAKFHLTSRRYLSTRIDERAREPITARPPTLHRCWRNKPTRGACRDPRSGQFAAEPGSESADVTLSSGYLRCGREPSVGPFARRVCPSHMCCPARRARRQAANNARATGSHPV